MKTSVIIFFSTLLLLTACFPSTDTFVVRKSYVGKFSGIVLDPQKQPVANAMVQGIYRSRWIVVIPPAGGLYTTSTTKTDAYGRFQLYTSKKTDKLTAFSDDVKLMGELESISNSGNVIMLHKNPCY